MRPLLEIKTVPILIEYKVNSARIQKVEQNATVEVSRSRNNVRMRSRPIRMNVDTIEASPARGRMPSVARGSRVNGNAPAETANIASSPPRRQVLSSSATYSASARFIDDGRVQVDMSFSNEAVSEITSQMEAAIGDAGFVSSFPEPSFIPQDFSVTYEIDKMVFDWTSSSRNIEFEFVPADIEFSVLEYPSVVIEYVGDPIYIPPSSNPNYEPVDARV